MGAYLYQTNGYSCGTIAFLNAAKIFGADLSYQEAKALVGTTSKDGTGRSGLLRGISALGLRATEYRQANVQAAWRWLWRWADTCPIILLVDGCLNDENSHWVAVTGRVVDRVIVVDSSPNLKRGENGVHPYDRDALMTRWKQRICYGIRLQRI